MGVAYRVRQFWQAMSARRLSPAEWQQIEKILSPAESRLFSRLSTADQAHSYRVLQALLDQGHQDRPLLAAALLHDVGKTRIHLPLWLRPVIILGQAVFGRRVEQWGQGEPAGWRAPFVIKARHAEWGATMAAAAGSDAATVALIRRHQERLSPGAESGEEPLLRLLQQADDDN
jgi:hypothetical protein